MTPGELEKIAEVLARISMPREGARPFYDMLSDALVWDDELPRGPIKELHLIRPVLRHRTCLILQEPSGYREWWETAARLFPNWVGFLDERQAGSEQLWQAYHSGRAHAEESMKRHVE